MSDLAILNQFEITIGKIIPGAQVKFKNESWLMKMIGFILSPFNPGFMTDYITTIGYTVYFPTRQYYESAPEASFSILTHEFVHMWDRKQDSLFSLKYLFPQILLPIPLVLFTLFAFDAAWILGLLPLAYVIGIAFSKRSRASLIISLVAGSVASLAFGVLFAKWRILILLGCAVLAPWPAFWRSHYELRGYGMNMALQQWLYGTVAAMRDFNFFVSQFTTLEYYRMSWNPSSIRTALEKFRSQAESGELQKSGPYEVVYQFINSQNMVKTQ